MSSLNTVLRLLHSTLSSRLNGLTCENMWPDACEVDRPECRYFGAYWHDRVKLSTRLVGVALRGPDCATLPRARCAERGD